MKKEALESFVKTEKFNLIQRGLDTKFENA